MARNPQEILKAAAPIFGGATALGFGLYGFNNCLYNVEAGFRAIKFNRLTGVGETAYEEGTHVMIPWFDRPIFFDIRTRPRTMVSLTGSRDLQMVNISVSRRYQFINSTSMINSLSHLMISLNNLSFSMQDLMSLSIFA